MRGNQRQWWQIVPLLAMGLLVGGCHTPWQLVKAPDSSKIRQVSFVLTTTKTDALQVGGSGDAIPETMFLEQQSAQEKERWQAMKKGFTSHFHAGLKESAPSLRFATADNAKAARTQAMLVLQPHLVQFAPGAAAEEDFIKLHVAFLQAGKVNRVIAFTLRVDKAKAKGQLADRLADAARQCGVWTARYIRQHLVR